MGVGQQETSAVRCHRIHLAASTVVPLALLVSVSYTVMYRAAGLFGRYLTPLLAILFFIAGYFMQVLQAKLFHLSRVDFAVEDDSHDRAKRYVHKRYLLLPALVAMIPAALMVPLVDSEIRRLVDVGKLDYYSDGFLAPWLVFAVIVVSTAFGAAAWLTPGNVAVKNGTVVFHMICHAALYIIDLFMEVPSVLPCLLAVAVGIVSVFELNLSFVEEITRKTGDVSGLDRLRESNYQYVKQIVRGFIRVFLIPFLLCAAFSVYWQYALEHVFNQPL